MAQSIFTTRQFASDGFVESCGALLFNLSDPRAIKVCLVNLVHKNEWLLAKGRRNVGESRKDAALREVTEETGFRSALLPVTMATRACDPGGPVDAPDKPTVYDGVTEPFMCTLRDLPDGKGVKIIWWFVAVLEGDEEEQCGRAEEGFKAEFFLCEEAVQKLKFETDREVLRKAVDIVEATMACVQKF